MTPFGVAIEMIYGADGKSPKVWKLFAMQIFSEAEGDYRSIGHFGNGAPYLDGVPQKITLSHTPHFWVVASLPKTPDIDLSEFNPRTAIGIDLEKADRAQVLKIREKFLCEDELELLPEIEDVDQASPDTIRSFILAWTCKEALYKSIMGDSPDWKNDYRIISLPKIAECLEEATPDKYGKAEIILHGDYDSKLEMQLSAWETEGHVLTIAFSPKIARFPVTPMPNKA